MNSSDLHEWDKFDEKSEISTKELDILVSRYKEIRDEVDVAKKAKSKIEERLKVVENQLLKILKFTKKTSYDVAGVGRITLRNRTSVQTPKTPEDKKLMLQHFRDLGADAYLTYVSVNSATLNKYLKDGIEEDPLFQIPGVGDPVKTPNLSFTKR